MVEWPFAKMKGTKGGQGFTLFGERVGSQMV